MAHIGLVVRPGVEQALLLAQALITWVAQQGHQVSVEAEAARALGLAQPGLPADELVAQCDPVVTLGGDGTLIGVARYAGAGGPTFLGVNFGNLGFLTEVTPAELFDTLQHLLEGQVEYAERSMLHVAAYRGERRIFRSQAVNDAVVQKGARDRLLDLDLEVDGEAVMRLRADGLIVATPTGSTAYSLAAGGSIAYPTLEVVLVTPICPHSLTSRPLVLSSDASISVRVPPYDGKVFLVVDGQVSVELESGDVVKISRAAGTVRFVRSPQKNYFDILRAKLNWGLGNRA